LIRRAHELTGEEGLGFCMGLAMLCAVRFLAHGILLWQLRPLGDSQPQLQAA
jgi:hypothetical protein